MPDPFRYAAQFRSARGGWAALPPWARRVVFAFALPGLACVALSILMLGASVLAVLILTVPAYRVLHALTRPTAAGDRDTPSSGFGTPFGGPPIHGGVPGRRRVDATVTDAKD